jgi:hypothetical protein
MSYFELKKQLQSGSTTKHTGSSYFSLKEKIQPALTERLERERKEREEQERRARIEEASGIKEQRLQEARDVLKPTSVLKEAGRGIWEGAKSLGRGARDLAKDVTGRTINTLGTIAKGKQFTATPEESQEAFKATTGLAKGAGKSLAELGSGLAGAIYEVPDEINKRMLGENLFNKLDQTKPKIFKEVGESKILNYKPEYKDEYERTGGEIGEVGSWFIPITRGAKVEKIEEAIKALPKVKKLLGVTPQVVKSGSKFFYEVAKDVVDTVALEKTRGKSWEELEEEATLAGIGGAGLRGIGLVFSKLGNKSSRLQSKINKGELTEKDVVDLFDEGGIEAVEEKIITTRKLQPGELARETEAVEKITGDLNVAQRNDVRAKLEEGMSVEEVAEDIISPKVEPGVKPKPTKKKELKKAPSKVAKSIEAKSIEKNLTEGFQDVAEFDKITVKEQAKQASKLLKENFDDAIKMIEGTKRVEKGLNKATLIKAMEDYAQDVGDTELLRKLAKSPLVSETSEAAQTLRMLAERNPESALANIQKVIKQRADKAAPNAKSKVVKDIKKKVKQPIPTKKDWGEFIDSITC